MKRFLLVAAFFGLLFVTPLSFAKDINVHAYRDIEFGDSPKTVIEKFTSDPVFHSLSPSAYNEDNSPDAMPSEAALKDFPPFVILGGNEFDVYFTFYQKKLYQIDFSSIVPLDANYFDSTVRDDADILKQIMTRAKGSPDETYAVSLLDMQAGHITYTAVWNKDVDGVKRTVGIGETGAEFYADLQLTYVPLYQVLKSAQQQKKNEQINQDSNDF